LPQIKYLQDTGLGNECELMQRNVEQVSNVLKVHLVNFKTMANQTGI